MEGNREGKNKGMEEEIRERRNIGMRPVRK